MNRLTLVMALAIMLLSCAKKEGTVELSGQINELNTNFIMISSRGVTDTIQVNEDGSFAATLSIAQPAYYSLTAQNVYHTLFLTPNSSLSISIDLTNPAEGIAFEGDNAEVNSCIFQVNTLGGELMNDFSGLFSLPGDEFQRKLNASKDDMLALLSRSGTNNKEFLALEEARIGYRIKELEFNYPYYNAMLAGKNFSPTSESLAILDGMDFSNRNHVVIDEYIRLIESYLRHIEWKRMVDRGSWDIEAIDRLMLRYNDVDSVINQDDVANLIKSQFTQMALEVGDIEQSDSIVGLFVANSTDGKYWELARATQAKRMLLAAGQPAPGFTLTSIDGDTISLSDLRGKLVYLDFWTTWCGPCRQQIPHLKALKEKYNDQPIVFVAISLDDDKGAWENFVRGEQLGGYQLHAEGAWYSHAAQEYQIRGVPTFVLIDGNGKIIKHGAPVPSDHAILAMLDENLSDIN